jgi:hypothetical protein
MPTPVCAREVGPAGLGTQKTETILLLIIFQLRYSCLRPMHTILLLFSLIPYCSGMRSASSGTYQNLAQKPLFRKRMQSKGVVRVVLRSVASNYETLPWEKCPQHFDFARGLASVA